jgi:Ca2+-binding EF-hand superfamily protein
MSARQRSWELAGLQHERAMKVLPPSPYQPAGRRGNCDGGVVPLREQLRGALAKHSGKILDFFQSVDVDAVGTISFATFARCLPRLGLRASGEEARSLFEELDLTGTGEIPYSEIQRLLRAGGKLHMEENGVRLAGHRAVQVGEPPSLTACRTKVSRGEFSPPYAWYWAFKGKAWDRETASYEAAAQEYREARRKARQLARGAGAETRAEKDDVMDASAAPGPSVKLDLDLDRSEDAPPIFEQVLGALARRSVRVMDLFRDWDDGSGAVSEDDFAENITRLGVHVPQADCASLFRAISKGSDYVSLSELEQQLQRARPDPSGRRRSPVLGPKDLVLVLGPAAEPAVKMLAHRLADSIGGMVLDLEMLAAREVESGSSLGGEVLEIQRRQMPMPRRVVLALLSSAIRVLPGPFFILDFPRSLTSLQQLEAAVGSPFFGVELRCPGRDVSDMEGMLDELKQGDKLLRLPQHTDALDALRQVRTALCARRQLDAIRDEEASLARHDAVRRERQEKKKRLEADVADMRQRLRACARGQPTAKVMAVARTTHAASADALLLQRHQRRDSQRCAPGAKRISSDALLPKVTARPQSVGKSSCKAFNRHSAAVNVRVASQAYGVALPMDGIVSAPSTPGLRKSPCLPSPARDSNAPPADVWSDPRPPTTATVGTSMLLPDS